MLRVVPPEPGIDGHGASLIVPGRRKWRNAVNGGQMWKPSGPLMHPKPRTSTRHAHRNAFWNAISSVHHDQTPPNARPGVKLTQYIHPTTTGARFPGWKT